jgi:hypothetical protein
MKRKFYAMYDFMAHPDDPDGFANSKRAYAFSRKKVRDSFVANRRWDFSCKAITAREAWKFREWVGPEEFAVPPYQKNGQHMSYTNVIGRYLPAELMDDGVRRARGKK